MSITPIITEQDIPICNDSLVKRNSVSGMDVIWKFALSDLL